MNILTAHLLALRNAVCLIHVVSMQQIFRFVKNVFAYFFCFCIIYNKNNIYILQKGLVNVMCGYGAQDSSVSVLTQILCQIV